ncbi:nuclear transport factor 2 family protein [Nocardia abscessus]|uniref:nuclear transport factor 2 family protein n=1 Tax=Nocardia abscessus TaxID=120957 RepID=UPI00245724D2|nr:nuclear transport factor 2 family protein [Nocardia abscessus]
MTNENPAEGAIHRYFDALQTGSPMLLKECFTDDARWFAPGRLPNSGVWRGPNAIVEEFFPIAMARMRPGSFTTELLSLTIGDSNAVVEWRSRATTTSGHEYDNAYIANFVVSDGKISEVREYFDTQRGETLYQ